MNLSLSLFFSPHMRMENIWHPCVCFCQTKLIHHGALSQRLQIWTHTSHQGGSERYYLIIGVDPYIENYLAIFLSVNCTIALSYMFKNLRAIFNFFLSQDRALVSISSQLYSYNIFWNGLFLSVFIVFALVWAFIASNLGRGTDF